MGARAGRTATAVSRVRKPTQKVPPGVSQEALDSELNIADKKLLDNLKSVYVESTTTSIDVSSRPKVNLPKERSSPMHDPLDITEPVEGYLTVSQVIQVLDYQRLNAEKSDKLADVSVLLSEQYKMDPVDIRNLLKYFGNYYVRPDEKKDKFELKYHLLHQ